MNTKILIAIAVTASCLTGAGLVLAQTASPPPTPAPLVDYHPTIADLMTAFVQPRHTKLGLAAKAGNWTYAAYEASELRNAFNRIQRDVPVFENTNTAELMASTVMQPLGAAIAAAKAGDAKAFTTAYAEVTKSCNACHDSFKKGFIAIKIPDGAMFPDQEFKTPKKSATQ